jgi:hypothetical protein
VDIQETVMREELLILVGQTLKDGYLSEEVLTIISEILELIKCSEDGM